MTATRTDRSGTRSRALAILLAILTLTGVGCSDPEPVELDPMTDQGRTTLRWRRFEALLADYGRALELSPADACRDADGSACAVVGPVSVTEYLQSHRGVSATDAEARCAELQGSAQCDDTAYITEYTPKGVHVFALGGNEPFLGEFSALEQPGLTTPLAIDRVALLACGERVRRDAEGTPVVFTHLDLSLSDVDRSTPGLEETVAELFRRLLARDATEDEVDAVLSILDAGVSLSAREAARLTCFTIATTTEVVFQ